MDTGYAGSHEVPQSANQPPQWGTGGKDKVRPRCMLWGFARCLPSPRTRGAPKRDCFLGNTRKAHNRKVSDLDSGAISPFLVKGLLYQGTRAYFDTCVEGGYPALLAALRPKLRSFMEQPFIAGARYDVMLVPELIEVEASVARQRLPQYLQTRTAYQARQDLGGIYRLMVRVAPTPIVIKRVAVVMAQMFSFGSARVDKEAEGHLRVKFLGIPDPLVPWLEQCLRIYGTVALEIGCAGNASCEAGPRSPSDAVRGYPTSSLCVDVKWG